MKPSVLSTLQQAILITKRLAVRITPSSRSDLTMIGVMMLGLTVNELLKIEKTLTLGINCDTMAFKKCALRIYLIFLNYFKNNSY